MVTLGSKVSNKTQKKITEGLQHVHARTTAVVHVDLIAYSNNFIDNQVKPQVAFISGLPKQVEEQFNSNVSSAKTVIVNSSNSVKNVANVVATEFNNRVVVPTSDALSTVNKDETEVAKLQLIIKTLAEQARFAWNDLFLVPATAFLSLPDLKPVTLYNAAIKSSQYAYLVKNYELFLSFPATVSQVAQEKTNAAKAEVSTYLVTIQTYVNGQVSTAFAFVLPYVSQYSKVVLPYLPASAVSALENLTKSA